ncbi:MAG TPA: hypothetical protein VJG90_02335 [Candidatus Nanoarchaeia archaeon]|nr:hypothetical protein [Candidatus Nanoarchaeia archaeon]
MKQESVQIAKKKSERLTEEEQFLRKPETLAALKEYKEAKKKGVKTWELKY